MSLTKWFRKNTKKLMAVVVVLLMFAFLMPQFLRQLQREQRGVNEPFGFFGDNVKITRGQVSISAQRELNILRVLVADQFLFAQQDLRAYLLAELLFYEPRVAAGLSSQLKTSLRQGRLRISPVQIDKFFEQRKQITAPAELYWLLLKTEAAQAGIAVPPTEAKRVLSMVIPQLTGGYRYSTIIGSIVNRHAVPEEEILQTFRDLLGVLLYSQMTTSNENVTISQLRHGVRSGEEKLDMEFVKFDASFFTEDQPEPNEQEVAEHFEKYKGFYPGQISEDNSYGFGYKLPELVQFEHMAVKLDDVGELVEPPSEEEKERYYQANIQILFTASVPVDPNDPASEKVQRTRSYAEVASIIGRQLLREKINAKGEAILNDAKRLTEAGLENVEIERIGSEEFEQLAGDYTDAAEKAGEKYAIKIYAGKTGMLSAEDLFGDGRLGRLYVTGLGGAVVELVQIAFSVDRLGPTTAARLGPFDVPAPRMYENIGPLKERFSEGILVLARVIDAQKASEPEDIDQTYSKGTLPLDEEPGQSEKTYSVREAVVEDIKLLKAMEIAKRRSQEFIELAQAQDWETVIKQFNEQYAGPSDPNTYSPRPFRLQRRQRMQRDTNLALMTSRLHYAGNPREQALISLEERDKNFTDKIYSLLPPDKETVENLPLVLEYKPDKSFYAIKSLSRTLVSRDRYEKAKGSVALAEDGGVAQGLAVHHFSPENIEKRMNFKRAERQRAAPKSDKPATTSGGGA